MEKLLNSTSEDDAVRAAASERWLSLTKPAGSLGRLEEMVERLAAIRGTAMPEIKQKAIFVFCADHGVAARGVSAYPPEVTAQMVGNFLRGGAAISVLCRRLGIDREVVDIGVRGPIQAGVLDRRIAEGTRDFTVEPAMSMDEAARAVDAGRRIAAGAATRYDIIGLGEMGIGNTTAASALLAAFAGLDPAEVCGAGTGVDDAGMRRKVEAVRAALALHRPDAADGMGTLAAVGGFEIAAMAGAILGAAEARLPVVLDGFISCSAALVARAIEPNSLNAVLYAHRSAERGHRAMLDALGAEPYLDLGMRLGEGTGAALFIGVLESALALYREMATFAEASVSGRDSK
jgi:nicotinate-nucleotide--dimethylbenzimidazole phosphoribosyltransferase